MEKLISVIVPIYNVEKFLPMCLDSICNQTYQNLEIICVNDGSTDRCGEICEYYAKRDGRIKVIHKINGGLHAARISGIEVATGAYVGYVDSDDWIEPQMYEKMITVAEKYQAPIVECGIFDATESGEKIRLPYLDEGKYEGEQFEHCVRSHLMYTGNFFESGVTPYLWNKLFRRDVVYSWQTVPGELMELYNDDMVTWPAVNAAQSLYVLREPLYHYRVRAGSLKRSKRNNTEVLVQHMIEAYVDKMGGEKCSEILRKQILSYTMYFCLYRIPWIFDSNPDEKLLVPFGGIEKQSRIVVYGAGAAGIKLWNYIEGLRGLVEPVLWVDGNHINLKNDLPVESPQKISAVEYDYIVIAVMRRSAAIAIKESLISMGIKQDKIRWILDEYAENPEKLLKIASYNGKKMFEL